MLPERPAGTEDWTEEQLAEIVTRDAMIGVAEVTCRRGAPMNGAHDLGGMHGLGPVKIEQDEPVFHSQWEKRMFALTLASGFHGKWNIDMSRYAREQMPPAEYLATTYYEHWLFGLQKLLVEQELVTAQELRTGHADAKKALLRAVRASEVDPLLRKRRAARLDEDVAPLFRVGDASSLEISIRPGIPGFRATRAAGAV